ncbi:MAG: M48 family metalloprotease [Oscillospiraceae bacterium]|nr:M48 family metalloprotease [Oscillospiraceae bacterium]
MKRKIFFARGMSRVAFVLLYILDIVGIYSVTGDVAYTAIGATGILMILAIQMSVSLLTLKAHSIKGSPYADANYLQSCMETVINRSETVGRKRRKIRLWISDNESLNCYTVGRNIIVNRSVLRLGDRTILEALLAHEYSHVLNYDSYFAALLEMNLFIGLCIVGLSLFGAAVVIVLMMALLFGLIFSSWVGFTAGAIFGKILKGGCGLVSRAFYYISKAFSAFLYRRQEYEADRYTALLGYSRAMVNLFRLEERMEQHAVQVSWIEELLDDHPSNYRRTVQFERMEEEIAKLEKERQGYEIKPYENPFS